MEYYNTMLSGHHLKHSHGMGEDFFASAGTFFENLAQATINKVEEQAPQVLAQQILAANVQGYKIPVPVAVKPPTAPMAQAVQPTTVTLPAGTLPPVGYTQIPLTQTAIKKEYFYIAMAALALLSTLVLVKIIKK